MFGSVPLKTYLPDGDIDLALFQKTGPSIRNNWYKRLADILEAEQRRPGPFAVRDVQVHQRRGAQVLHNLQLATGLATPPQKTALELQPWCRFVCLKCLVDNIVVDISFETLGGLCTLAFLESIDRKLQEDNLFKRSIILVCPNCPSGAHVYAQSIHHRLSICMLYAVGVIVVNFWNFLLCLWFHGLSL